MPKEIKPIKRSEQLAPLSRDHHEGLLFVWKIHLQEHFKEEEQILAPSILGNELVKRMLDEHQNIEALIQINENIADEILLGQLADAVNDHIRFEERELFPYAERMIPVEKLNSIHVQLLKPKVQCEQWQNEFWLKK